MNAIRDANILVRTLAPSISMSTALIGCSGRPQADGEYFIKGVVVSYEVLCRLADAVGLRDLDWDYVSFTAVATRMVVSDQQAQNILGSV